MAQPAEHAAPDLSLRASLARARAEMGPVVGVVMLLAAMLMFGHFIYALTRASMHSTAVYTKSDLDAAVLGTAVLFMCMAMVCLHHVEHWILDAASFRFAHTLSAPAVIASASAMEDGESPTQALEDVDRVVQKMRSPLFSCLAEIAMTPLLVLMLIVIHWSFLVLAAVMITMRALLALATDRIMLTELEAANTAHMKVMANVGNSLNAAESIEAMGMAPALTRRWVGDLTRSTGTLERLRRRQSMMDSFAFALDNTIQPSPIVLMAVLSLSGIPLGGTTSGLNAHLVTLAAILPFAMLVGNTADLASLRGAWTRLQALATRQQARDQVEGSFLCPEGRLEVDHLTVLLPGMHQPLIRDLSFRLEPGLALSLVGPVGSGKSTLLRALIGIVQPTSGGCYLDGHATSQWDRVALSRHIGFLPQDVGLVSGTVADAIARLGPPDMERVLEASQRAGAHQVIVNLPNGYSTRLGDYSLSAGQRQRIALARAIYGRPKLVVLDEPGAWLDADGLARLRQLLALLKQEGTSVIFSTHEPGLLEAADHGISLGPAGTPPTASSRRRLAAPVAQAQTSVLA